MLSPCIQKRYTAMGAGDFFVLLPLHVPGTLF